MERLGIALKEVCEKALPEKMGITIEELKALLNLLDSENK